jgi:rhamnogalacturonyl hydrolase YesR
MLKQLADDQAYRHRWQQERNSSRARWRRSVSWTVAVIGGAIVATASIVSLVHALL